MATDLCDESNVILVDFIERESTATADVYCATLTKLKRAIGNQRGGKLYPA